MCKKNKKQTAAVIIGAGYLGRTLAGQLQEQGERVHVTTRKAEKLHGLKEISAQAGLLDVNEPETWGLLAQWADCRLHLYLLIPPSQIEPDAFTEFVARLRGLPLHKAMLASSTVVYGKREREVDADSEVEIDSARTERQYCIEQLWRGLGRPARIVRLAGLYGAGRIIGRGTILNGEAVPGLADAWLNLIHVRDAARLLMRVGQGEQAAIVELGCDGRPVRRRDYYAALARHLNSPPPLFVEHERAGRSGRRCNNQITMQRTGWRPEFLNYKSCF